MNQSDRTILRFTLAMAVLAVVAVAVAISEWCEPPPQGTLGGDCNADGSCNFATLYCRKWYNGNGQMRFTCEPVSTRE